jgi:hypothetical protein
MVSDLCVFEEKKGNTSLVRVRVVEDKLRGSQICGATTAICLCSPAFRLPVCRARGIGSSI